MGSREHCSHRIPPACPAVSGLVVVSLVLGVVVRLFDLGAVVAPFVLDVIVDLVLDVRVRTVMSCDRLYYLEIGVLYHLPDSQFLSVW